MGFNFRKFEVGRAVFFPDEHYKVMKRLITFALFETPKGSTT